MMLLHSEFDHLLNIDRLRDLVKIQGEDGNWNDTPYMLGLYNGMELALSIMENREPTFRELTNFKRTP